MVIDAASWAMHEVFDKRGPNVAAVLMNYCGLDRLISETNHWQMVSMA
jgi:hypothetical protein